MRRSACHLQSPAASRRQRLRDRTREFASGDRLQFTAPDKELGVFRRELGTVTKLSRDEISVRLDGKEGRSISFHPKEFRSFDHGYAVTSHSAQGLTTERVLVNIDADGPRGLINGRLAYVAISRAAHEAQVYTNDARGLAAALSTENSKTSAVEFRQTSPTKEPHQQTHEQNKPETQRRSKRRRCNNLAQV